MQIFECMKKNFKSIYEQKIYRFFYWFLFIFYAINLLDLGESSIRCEIFSKEMLLIEEI